MWGPRELAHTRAVLAWRKEVNGVHPEFALLGVPAFGKCHPGACMNRSHIIRMNTGCVYEDIVTAPVWDDETKAFLPHPAVHRSAQDLSRGAILRPGLFWFHNGALCNMAGRHLAPAARRHTRYDWTRKRVRHWHWSSSDFRTIFYRCRRGRRRCGE